MIALDLQTATRLISSRFPDLAGEPVCRLADKGTDNHIFRIGDRLCARFPKVAWATDTARRETSALPRFARVALAVPEVYGVVDAGEGYPCDWSVLSWLPGQPLEDSGLSDAAASAGLLAAFIKSVRAVPADPAFAGGPSNNGRGAALAIREASFRAALEWLPGVNSEFAMRLSADALQAGTPESEVWLHGDLHPGNILVIDGRLTGVIDWGLCGVGDGACDLLSAWAIFDKPAREVFRASIDASDAEWQRGAGWALLMAVIYLPYAYANGLRCDMSERMISRLMEDFG